MGRTAWTSLVVSVVVGATATNGRAQTGAGLDDARRKDLDAMFAWLSAHGQLTGAPAGQSQDAATKGPPLASRTGAMYKIRIIEVHNVERHGFDGDLPTFGPHVYSDGVDSFDVTPVMAYPWQPTDKPAAEPKKDPNAPKEDGKKPEPANGSAPQSGGQPSLDELLGIKPKQAPTPAPKPADAVKPEGQTDVQGGPKPDPSRADLDRLLTAQEMGDAFKQAITLMGDASVRLNDQKDPGLDTQRVQEDVIKRLDQLLASLQKRQHQQQQQQQQQDPKQNPQQQKQQQKQPQPQQQGGDGMRRDLGPTLQDGTLRPELESARAAWGSLPARVRDMLMQGAEDRFSQRYKALTQQYYKRLAEENSK